MNHEINRIQSEVHNIAIYRINEVSRFCYNDKLIILEDGYHNILFKSTCQSNKYNCKFFYDQAKNYIKPRNEK